MLEDPYEYTPHPKTRFWGWTVVLWTSALLLFCFAIAYCARAGAESFSASASNGDQITLFDEPCEIPYDWFKTWRKAIFMYRGQTYAACWHLQRTTVIVMDADGDMSSVPAGAFSKNEAI